MGKKRNPVKAAKLVKALLKHNLNKAEAAEELGVTRQAVQEQVNQNPLVRSALEEYLLVLKESGVDDKKSARVISEGMDAERTVSVEDDREEAQQKKKRGGQPYVQITEPDHNARLKANDQYLKIKRLLTDPKSQDPVNPGGQHIHYHFKDRKTNELLGEIAAQLTTLSKGKPKVSR